MVCKKNFKYLIISILILVLTIGLSVSFFVSFINKDSNTTSTTSNIVELEDTKFLIEGNLYFNDLNINPGHKNISSIKVTATGDQEINYDLVWNGINELSNINYTVYKTDKEIDTKANCIRKTEENNSTTKYYEECNITNLVNLGEVISSGTITSSDLEQNVTLKDNENIQATKEGTVVYYYVILEFPNLDLEQNIDMNKKFDGIVTVESAELGNKTLTIPKILGKYAKNNSRTGEITVAFQESTPTTVYSKEDDDGISYVFAGVNPNNWVKLGNMYFRIIRFNGDGTIRLIYSGISSPATNGAATRIGINKFNLNNNNNMYVGLQYTEGEAHGNNVNSNILGDLESLDASTLYGWYNSKIKPEYSSLIDTNAKFCNNRESYTDKNGLNLGGGIGTTETYYGAYVKYVKGGTGQKKYIPSLKCPQIEDILRLPVGLITVDEYMLAGGGINISGYTNIMVWLHTGENYWTMSPSSYRTAASVIIVNGNGHLDGWYVTSASPSIRPVINLKSTTKFQNTGTGSPGSSTNPYEVVSEINK